MQSIEFLKSLGIAAALVASITSLILAVINFVFARRLAAGKEEHENELQEFKGKQDAAFADFRARADEHLEASKALRVRQERIESDLVRSRGEAYGEIWGLTGALSLFGPNKCPSASELSSRLSNWYFEQGWLLTAGSKGRYFLIQEVLNFFILHSLSFRRPADEILFGAPSRAMDELRKIRNIELGVDPRGDDGRYTLREIQVCVGAWKSRRLGATRDPTLPEQAWVLLQFVMSSFRTHLADELKSGEVIPEPAPEPLPTPEPPPTRPTLRASRTSIFPS